MADEELKRKRALALQAQLRLKLSVESGEEAAPKENVIATTKDGGRIIERQDGSRVFASPGYSTSDPQTVERLMQGATPAQIVGESRDKQVLSERGGLVSVGAKALQGVPFIGEWMDEGMNRVAPGVGDNLRQTQGAMDRQRPGTALAAEIGGGIAGSVPLAIGAVGQVAKVPSMVGRAATGLGLGAVGGGVEGALAGAGAANDRDRGEGALVGGAIGAGFGGLVGGLAPVVGNAASSMASRVKKLDVRTIAEEFGISPKAARVVKSALVNDDLDAAARRLSTIGDDAMLADAGPATGQLLDAAAQSGGRALRTTTEAVTNRANAANTRLTKVLDDVLGPADGLKRAATDISRRTSAARQAAYDRAYSQAIDYASSKGRAIEDVLARVPDGTMRRAIQEANDAMKEAGKTNLQIMAKIADDGSVTFSEMPNVQQLDFLKRALGDVAQGEVDQFGRLTGAGLRANRLAGDLRDAVGSAVPSYKAAVKMGGDKIAEDRALDLGTKILSKKTTLEEVRDALKGASVEARDAARRGLRQNIEETLSHVKRTITDPDTEAREAMQLVKDMSSRANMQKARLILGTDAKALFDELERAEAALALRAATTRNSATAVRQAIQGQVKDEIDPGLIRKTLGRSGNPLDAAQSVTETLAGIDPRSMSEAQQQVMAEIADALTGIRGKAAEKALAAVNRAMKGQPLKDTEAKLIGNIIAGVGSGSGYQAATQSLEP